MTAQANAFHQLHHAPAPLVIANAWDAGSARLNEILGAKAVATTSAGVAWTLGYPDGDTVPTSLLVSLVKQITRVIRVPLSVDIEAGYSDDPAAVGAFVAQIIDAGAVGINIEDGANPPDLLCAKIAAAKAAGTQRGVNIFVNARTDVYLRGLAAPADRVEQTVLRAARYREAGADGVFVPGVVDREQIRELASRIELPLNVMARPELPPVAELAALGVRRLSAGSGISQVLWGQASVLMKSFLTNGQSDVLTKGAMGYGDINAMFQTKA